MKEQLKRGSHPLKEELITCLVDMCEPAEEDIGSSADWTKKKNRGGLKIINKKTFDVFLAIERRVREFFRVSTAQNLTTETKKIMMESVTSDEDVRSYWDMLATTIEWDKAEGKALFPMLVELWITIRGYSFARSFMEIYKRENKKSIEKSKGLRKKIT